VVRLPPGEAERYISENRQLVIFVLSFLLDYSITAALVGVTYFAITTHFQWKFSGQKNFLILFLIFAFLDNFLWPMFFVLDATITVRNPDIVKMFNLQPDEPIESLIGFGWFEFIMYNFQTLLATYIGYKNFFKKSKSI